MSNKDVPFAPAGLTGAARLDDSGPAFPVVLGIGAWAPGASLRDYFAAKAMAALIIDPARADQSREECARLSYLMADAMLATRSQAAPAAPEAASAGGTP